jgi:hypothetical protein
MQQALDGVVVMGLTKEEEHVRWRRRQQSTELEIYDYLPRLERAGCRDSVGSNYLPAGQRVYLAPTLNAGSSTPSKPGITVARRPVLYDTLRASLDWVVNVALQEQLKIR